jgi:Ca2+-binding EF-hand superfamily protein
MRRNSAFKFAAGLIFAAAVGTTSASMAQQTATESPAVKEWMTILDTDNDGTVSKTEYMTYMEKQFDALDTDHDGTLDIKELQHLRGVPATTASGGETFSARQLLLQMDPDKDGTISKDEFTKYASARFDQLDRDHDGTLDANELKQLGPAPKN